MGNITLSRAEGLTGLYLLFNDHDELIYVGISHDPTGRGYQHAMDKPWWSEVKRRKYLWFPTRMEAMSNEQALIFHECPRYNTQLGFRSVPLPKVFHQRPEFAAFVAAFRQAETAKLQAYRRMVKGIVRELERGTDLELVARSVRLSTDHIKRLYEQWKTAHQRGLHAAAEQAKLRARRKAAIAALQAIETDEENRP